MAHPLLRPDGYMSTSTCCTPQSLAAVAAADDDDEEDEEEEEVEEVVVVEVVEGEEEVSASSLRTKSFNDCQLQVYGMLPTYTRVDSKAVEIGRAHV